MPNQRHYVDTCARPYPRLPESGHNKTDEVLELAHFLSGHSPSSHGILPIHGAHARLRQVDGQAILRLMA